MSSVSAIADKYLHSSFQIQISGVKSFVNEFNDPVRLTLGLQKLIVSPTNLKTFGETLEVKNEFLTREHDLPLVHTVDKLEPNAVFDVDVRPIYETVGGRQIVETQVLWEQTSCRTRMHRK